MGISRILHKLRNFVNHKYNVCSCYGNILECPHRHSINGGIQYGRTREFVEGRGGYHWRGNGFGMKHVGSTEYISDISMLG